MMLATLRAQMLTKKREKETGETCREKRKAALEVKAAKRAAWTVGRCRKGQGQANGLLALSLTFE